MEGLERGIESARGDGCSVCAAAPETADAGTGKGCGLGAGSACAAEGTFQAACSAQADELQNSCLQKLAAGALLRARHLLCTGGETAGLDRLADRAVELYQPHKDHITQDARLRSLGGQIQKMRAAEESMPCST